MISGCMDMALMELPALAIMALMPPSVFFWRSSISFFMTFMLPTMLFRPAVTDPKAASKEQISAFADYQKTLIKGLAPKLAADSSMAIELEFAKATYNAISQLQTAGLEVLPMTYVRLLDQLLGPVSIPFNGEPLKGLQIMGPLETRALDFKQVQYKT